MHSHDSVEDFLAGEQNNNNTSFISSMNVEEFVSKSSSTPILVKI